MTPLCTHQSVRAQGWVGSWNSTGMLLSAAASGTASPNGKWVTLSESLSFYRVLCSLLYNSLTCGPCGQINACTQNLTSSIRTLWNGKLGYKRKDRAGEEGWRGSCQALQPCKKSIRMSPALGEQKLISVEEEIVLFSAFPYGSRTKSCVEVFPFLQHRLFENLHQWSSGLPGCRMMGAEPLRQGQCQGSSVHPPASMASTTSKSFLAKNIARKLLRTVNQAQWG